MMTDDIQVTNAEIFARYVEKNNNSQIWGKLISWPIIHDTLGPGKTLKLEGDSLNLKLLIEFDDQSIRKFYVGDFPKRFSMEELPLDIPNVEEIRAQIYNEKENARQAALKRIDEEKRKEEERRKAKEKRERQKERERLQSKKELQARREFEELKKKYEIIAEDETEPTSLLFVILKKYDEGEELEHDDINWLISQNHNEFTINYLIEHYKKHESPWDLIRAAKLYRKTNRPVKALALTKNLSPSDSRTKAALCTNRGAAFKDIGEYEKARALGKKALECQPDSYYAYNLLGAIAYKTGDLEEGDDHFDKAIELGGSPKAMEYEIRALLNSESEEYIRKTVGYLLAKDPQKYHWAKFYLPNN